MRQTIAAIFLLLALAVPQIANADDSALGKWHVTGSVSDHAFTLDCTFAPAAAGFGGTCIEVTAGGGMGHPGKAHKLNHGSVSGNHVTWSYPVSVMFMSFDMTFEGAVGGNHMTGTATAAGRKGSFAANRM